MRRPTAPSQQFHSSTAVIVMLPTGDVEDGLKAVFLSPSSYLPVWQYRPPLYQRTRSSCRCGRPPMRGQEVAEASLSGFCHSGMDSPTGRKFGRRLNGPPRSQHAMLRSRGAVFCPAQNMRNGGRRLVSAWFILLRQFESLHTST